MVTKTGIVYLQKDKFQIFSPFLGNILEFRFVPEVMRDLDVINSALLDNLVKVFVTNGKIPPSNLIFVLADNAYFTKDFFINPQQKTPAPTVSVAVSSEVLQKQIDEFVEHVPFDNVVSKTLPLKNGMKVCATNKDFYEAVSFALGQLGFTTESVIPGLVLGNGMSARPVLDQVIVNMVLQRANIYKQYDLLKQQVFQPQAKQETEEVDEVEFDHSQSKKPNKKRLIALSSIMASLLLVLIIVYVQTQAPPTPPKQPAHADTSAPASSVNQISNVGPTTLVAISPPSKLQTQDLTVQIVNASSSPLAAKNLLERMHLYQFKNVVLQVQSPVGSAATIVSFSSNTSQPVRNTVLDEVKKIKSNITVQEKPSAQYDITIVVGE